MSLFCKIEFIILILGIMNTLPDELVALIATNDFDLFVTLLRVPTIGTVLCSQYAQMIAKNKFIKVIHNNDTTITFLNNKMHSFNDEPALVLGDNSKVWYRYGKKHRVDLPAVIQCNGTKE